MTVDEAIQILADAGVTPAQYRAALRTRNPLPTWDEMSDLDKGAVLLHYYKRDAEGADYAVENYPCRYLEDPRLTALDAETASAHAAEVCEGVVDDLDGDEYQRLYNLALDHERS